MRLLHTADLHLGRQFFGRSLADDHAAVLAQVLKAVEDHRPDALIIAGDIFDRAAPPEAAVGQFNGFLSNLAEYRGTAIVLIAGNHDSGERIEAMSMFADTGRVLVRGALRPNEPALLLRDAHGPVAISALPFAYEYAARDCFGDPQIKVPADVVAAQVATAKACVPAGARWVVVAHAFVEGAAATESERPLTEEDLLYERRDDEGDDDEPDEKHPAHAPECSIIHHGMQLLVGSRAERMTTPPIRSVCHRGSGRIVLGLWSQTT